MDFRTDDALNQALDLQNSGIQYKQVVGFKNYLVFSDVSYPATMGTVVVLNNNNVVQKEIGNAGDSIGEYIFIGEDAPGGNVVVGISFSEGND